MGCLLCDRPVHPSSSDYLTIHHACTILDGKCLRVNCRCNTCMAEPGMICMFCEVELRPGSKPYLKELCRTCMRDMSKIKEWQKAVGIVPRESGMR